MPVERHLGNAGALGKRIDADGSCAVLREELVGRALNALKGIGGTGARHRR
jgi:hypothetical protein